MIDDRVSKGEIVCVRCGAFRGAPEDASRSCGCGSTERKQKIHIRMTARIGAVVDIHGKGKSVERYKSSGGGQKPVLETQFRRGRGADGVRVAMDRTIDRKEGTYRERVVAAETGEVLRDVRHQLTDHTGRGTERTGKTKGKTKGKT